MPEKNQLSEVSRYIARCPSCDAYLDIREQETAYTCPKCGSGYHETPQGLCMMDIEFASPPPDSAAQERRPFWVFFIEMPLPLVATLSPDAAWSDLAIYVPANDAGWDKSIEIGLQMTLWQPQYVPGPPIPLRGCVVKQQQALEIAQIIYVRILERVDLLHGLDLILPPLRSSKIIVVPVTREEAPLS